MIPILNKSRNNSGLKYAQLLSSEGYFAPFSVGVFCDSGENTSWIGVEKILEKPCH